MTTWFFDNIGIYKIYKSKTCQFLKIMQIIPNFICSNYKLFMIDFNNIHQVESNCMEVPSICAWCVEQFVMPPNLAHTCHGSTSQMASWLNCSQLLCIPNFTPYDNWQLAHQICFKPQNCLMLFGHWSKGMCSL